MPLFFFNVIDGTTLYPDREGVDLEGLATAREYALKDAKDLIEKRVISPAEAKHWRIEVVDETGVPAFTVRLSDAI